MLTQMTHWHDATTYMSTTMSTALSQEVAVCVQLTISPKGLRGNSPWGEAEWAIDPRPLRAKGPIVLVSPN